MIPQLKFYVGCRLHVCYGITALLKFMDAYHIPSLMFSLLLAGQHVHPVTKQTLTHSPTHQFLRYPSLLTFLLHLGVPPGHHKYLGGFLTNATRQMQLRTKLR